MLKKIKLIFVPCEENNFRPRFLDGQFLLYYLVILLILKLMVIPFFIYFPKTVFFADIVKSSLINLANEERQAMGLGPLKESAQLDRAAYLKAKDMMEKDYFDHFSPEGTPPWYWIKEVGYNYEAAGENLAIGFLSSEEVNQAWLDSLSHRENLLNPRFSEIGIAVLKGNFQGNETTLVVQFLATPKTKIAIKEQKVLAKEPENEIASPLREETVPSTSTEENIEEKEFIAEKSPTEEIPAAENIKAPAAETQPIVQTEKETKKDSFGFKFVSFLANKYQNILQVIIYFSLSFIIIGLLINIVVKFDVQHWDLILKASGFILLLIFFLWLDKGTIIQLIPHKLIIY